MNEKIKEIAEFDGWTFLHGKYWKDDGMSYYAVKKQPNYLTDLTALHRVALDVMDSLTELFNNTENSSIYIPIPDLEYVIKRALYIRPVNGQYTDLVDAVYGAIVYLKQHNLCQPK